MSYPQVTIDIDKIEHNTRVIVDFCRGRGIAVAGVTKCTCGHPQVATAMLRGGVSMIGESQLDNIRRLRKAGIHAAFMLLRLPAPAEADDVVALANVSLNSELTVLGALSHAAERRCRVHDVIIMVDLGDLREGLGPREVIPFIQEALKFPGIRIAGLGTNLACFGGVVPGESNMHRLVELANETERTLGLRLQWISGANSSGLKFIASGRMPTRVNQARIGEAILLGRETTQRDPWPGTFQDAFTLHAEILELKTKPSQPIGERSEDAFGHRIAFENHGDSERALVNIGREEVSVEGITPRDPRLRVLGASSSYLVVDMTQAAAQFRVGDVLTFSLNYGALLTAMTSEYVKKRAVRGTLAAAAPQSAEG